jgi:NitT/TauT family transport system ATP-binding protein
MTKKIVAENVTKIFPSPRGQVVALKNFSVEVEDGEFVCIVGP